MIKPDLKVGDRFEDGQGIFEVVEVVPIVGYISKRVGTVGEKPEKKPEVKELPFTTVEENNQLDSFNKYTKTEINRLNNAELTSLCQKLDLNPGTGVEMKKAIIEKLGL